jgi:hypothetical protein
MSPGYRAAPRPRACPNKQFSAWPGLVVLAELSRLSVSRPSPAGYGRIKKTSPDPAATALFALPKSKVSQGQIRAEAWMRPMSRHREMGGNPPVATHLLNASSYLFVAAGRIGWSRYL